MSGRSAQDKRKRDKRAVDMTQRAPEPEPWAPPPAEECEEEQYTFTPPDAHEAVDRIKLRTVAHRDSGLLARFAVVQQAKVGAGWHDVTPADSCHDGEVPPFRQRGGTADLVGPLLAEGA